VRELWDGAPMNHKCEDYGIDEKYGLGGCEGPVVSRCGITEKDEWYYYCKIHTMRCCQALEEE
jgi:hypothetical protein